ncbi:MAG: hypothetical protein AAGA64_18060 [Bacteroidota bacterium]
MSSRLKHITLNHLLIGGEKQIRLRFYPDKVLNAVVKGLPGLTWSDGSLTRKTIEENNK